MLTASTARAAARPTSTAPLDNGVTKEELVEVITHATFYTPSSWPRWLRVAHRRAGPGRPMSEIMRLPLFRTPLANAAIGQGIRSS